jgi:hypothetical protein
MVAMKARAEAAEGKVQALEAQLETRARRHHLRGAGGAAGSSSPTSGSSDGSSNGSSGEGTSPRSSDRRSSVSGALSPSRRRRLRAL